MPDRFRVHGIVPLDNPEAAPSFLASARLWLFIAGSTLRRRPFRRIFPAKFAIACAAPRANVGSRQKTLIDINRRFGEAKHGR